MTGRAPLVLVVTGSSQAAEKVCGELRRAAFVPALAVDGRTALRAAAQQPPALVVADLRLPDMEGSMMLRALRQLPELCAVPAIGLSPSPGVGEPNAFDHELADPVDAPALVVLARKLVADANANANANANPSAGASANPDGERPGQDRPHLLIVNHDDQQRRLALVCLRHAGYEVTATAGAAEAVELATKVPTDAVVSEVLMPGMDGYELALELRRRERTRRLPIILTCSPSAPVNPEMVEAVGASALVIQTADMGDLVDAIRSRLTPGPSRDQSVGEIDADRLERLLSNNTEMRERLADKSIELAFLAGLGAGISCGADPQVMLRELLARCAEATGFHCGAAYLAFGNAPPLLQGQVGFHNGDAVLDFFGDPALLADATRDVACGVIPLPSDRVDPERAAAVLQSAGLAQMVIAPIRDGGVLMAVIVLGSTEVRATAHEEALMGGITDQVGRWFSRINSSRGLSRPQRRLVERLARAAEFRDEETADHTKRVSQYCDLLARLGGISDARCELIAAASRMHDIGKLGIPDSILRKPDALTASERTLMQRHAEYGHRILSGESDPLFDLASTIAWTHHERWDGGGYPRGISGIDIPLAGRIVAIGDVFDALTSDRVYRPAMRTEDAIALMQAGRGTQFDPNVLDLFIDALPRVLDIRRRHPDRAHELRSAVVPA